MELKNRRENNGRVACNENKIDESTHEENFPVAPELARRLSTLAGEDKKKTCVKSCSSKENGTSSIGWGCIVRLFSLVSIDG
jgi:hypothetical protein